MTEDEYKTHLRRQTLKAFEDAVYRASEIGDTDTLLQLCSLGGGLMGAPAGGDGPKHPIGFQPTIIEEHEEEEYE